MNFIKWLLVTMVIIVIAIGSFLFYMQTHDGPIEVFAGGPFTSGQVIKGTAPDWNTYADLMTFEVQTLEPPGSRTTWLVVIDDKLYIPSGYMNTAFGKLWKQWPHDAVKDGRALVRIGDKIYPRTLVRIEADDPVVPEVVAALRAKYPGEATLSQVESSDTWIFELAPR
jgi:hypothetical protein